MSKIGSKEYSDMCKNKYLNNCAYPSEHKAVVFGVGENNIGNHIAQNIGADAFTIDEFDVSNEEQIMNFNFDEYDTFIFNNGETHLDWIENQPFDKIDSVFRNSIVGNIKCTKRIVEKTIDLPIVKTIIFIGSMAHNHVLNGSSPYCSAKAALQMFAKCIAYELAPKGFRVYCVNPSNVTDAPMSEETIVGLMRYKNLTRSEADEYWAAECPIGTFLEKQEISDIVKFLMTNDARYLSGAEINLVGGGR